MAKERERERLKIEITFDCFQLPSWLIFSNGEKEDSSGGAFICTVHCSRGGNLRVFLGRFSSSSQILYQLVSFFLSSYVVDVDVAVVVARESKHTHTHRPLFFFCNSAAVDGRGEESSPFNRQTQSDFIYLLPYFRCSLPSSSPSSSLYYSSEAAAASEWSEERMI